jgi:hypothetical protein
MSTQQQVFGLKVFAEMLVDKKKCEGVEALKVYFFSDKVLTRTFKKKDTYCVRPTYAVAVDDNEEMVNSYKLVDMKERFGDKFGIKFEQNKSRKLLPKALINAIRINVRETLEYKGYEYYNSRVFAPIKECDRCVQVLTDKLHPAAQTFKPLNRYLDLGMKMKMMKNLENNMAARIVFK